MKPTRPLFRWHGGKWKSAPRIIRHFPLHQLYHEPYCGGASVLARKWRSPAEVINDLSGGVVNVFQVLRDPDQAARLEQLLRLTPFAEAEFELAYQPTDDPIEAARRMITRCHLGFGSTGGHPGRRTGFRRRPFRQRRNAEDCWAELPDHVRLWVERFQGVVVTRGDALESLARYDQPDTLHYVDPPYLDHTRAKVSGRDYEHGMTDDQHRELAEALNSLEGMVVLSGYPSEEYEAWFSGWHRVTFVAQTNRNKTVTEALWLNPAAMAAGAVAQPSLFQEVAA